jgi:hypothetical protein
MFFSQTDTAPQTLFQKKKDEIERAPKGILKKYIFLIAL